MELASGTGLGQMTCSLLAALLAAQKCQSAVPARTMKGNEVCAHTCRRSDTAVESCVHMHVPVRGSDTAESKGKEFAFSALTN